MVNKKALSVILVIGFLLTGCGSSSVKNDEGSVVISSEFSHKVINNQGQVIEAFINDYEVKILSTLEVESNPQERHIGLVVRINGEKSKTLHLQNSYIGEKIIVGVYKLDKLIKVSETIEITEKPVTIIDIEL